MTTTGLFSELNDRELIDVTKRLAGEETRATAVLLRALIEVDTRRLYLTEGCASLFVWCTEVLHLCEGGAYNRIEVARAARTYPILLTLVEDGAITLTAARLLAPHLTPANHAAVLAEARHRSKREIEVLVAALQPKPDAPTLVRRLPGVSRDAAHRATPTAAPGTPATCLLDAEVPPSAPPSAPPRPTPSCASPPTAPPRASVVPLAPERYRIQVTVSRETHDRLRRAGALLRHAVPSGDTAEILDRALALLVEQLERRRFAETSRPRTAEPTGTHSRHIPAAVRREVWKRDEGRCAFVGHRGRCTESALLEFHHVIPYAMGGPATTANIALRCRAHNAHEARLFFGT